MSIISTSTRPQAAAEPTSSAIETETFHAAITSERGLAGRFGRGGRLRWPLGIYTTPLLILVLWQVASTSGALSSTVAPAPAKIVTAAFELWGNGELGGDLAISLHRVALGLTLGLSIAIPAGIAAGLLRSGEYAFNGIVQILNTIPLLAILPVAIVWFGIGELTKVVLISFGAGLPMYLNLFAAIRGIDQGLIEMATSAGARRWRLIGRVIFPGALPGFLIGLRFSLAYSVLGLVAAETVNADSGIGYLITRAQTYLRTDQVFLGLVIYACLGLLADQVVRTLERVFLTWRPTYQGR